MKRRFKLLAKRRLGDYRNMVFARSQIYGFYIFSKNNIKKSSQIQNFRILQPLVDFILNAI